MSDALVDVSAETAVLANLIQKPGLFLDVASRVRPDHFSSKAHAVVYDCIQQAAENAPDSAYDIFRVSNEIRRSGMADFAATPTGEPLAAYVHTLGSYRVAGDIAFHVDSIAQAAARRRIKQEAEKIIHAAEDPRFPIQDSVTPVISEIQGTISDTLEADSTVRTFGHVLNEFMERLENLEEVERIPTGFDELDRSYLSGGLEASRVLTIGARPGVGKTAFGLSIARFAALKKRKKVLFASFEMSPEQLMRRIIAAESGIALETFNNPARLPEQDRIIALGKIAACEDRLLRTTNLDPDDDRFDPTKGGIFFWDKADTTIQHFLIRAKEMHKRGRLDMIIIDYLQLIQFGASRESRQLEVASIMRAIKLAALDMKIPIVVLSQLNRGSANRADTRPQLTDLRESGSIEQDSDHVILLWRQDLEGDRADEQLHDNVLDIAMEKNRDGRMGRMQLLSQLEYGRFVDLAPEDSSGAWR